MICLQVRPVGGFLLAMTPASPLVTWSMTSRDRKSQGRDTKIFEALHLHNLARQINYYSPSTIKHNFSKKTANINVQNIILYAC